VAGRTSSTNFPGTTGGAQASNNGGSDAFVAKLNPNLTKILQSTYLGGGDDDGALAIAIHPTTGDIYVAGRTLSFIFPGTAGGAQARKSTGSDAFVSRLNSSLTQLLQSTYLGGGDDDEALTIAIHPTTGDVYVAGKTLSPDFPKTAGGARENKSGGSDAFVARLSSGLNQESPIYLPGRTRLR
jgi:hypothetical protein